VRLKIFALFLIWYYFCKKLEYIVNRCQLILSTIGLFLDLIGVLVLILISKSTKGAVTETDENFLIERRFGPLVANSWFTVSIILIIIGFFTQLSGNIIVLFG
jgi:hypothetical protein